MSRRMMDEPSVFSTASVRLTGRVGLRDGTVNPWPQGVALTVLKLAILYELLTNRRLVNVFF